MEQAERVQLKKLVSQGETQKMVALLESYFSQRMLTDKSELLHQLYDDFLLLNSRFQIVTRNEDLRLMNTQEIGVEMNQINRALLNLVNKIPAEKIPEKQQPPKTKIASAAPSLQENVKQTKSKKWLIPLVGTLILVVLAVAFWRKPVVQTDDESTKEKVEVKEKNAQVTTPDFLSSKTNANVPSETTIEAENQSTSIYDNLLKQGEASKKAKGNSIIQNLKIQKVENQENNSNLSTALRTRYLGEHLFGCYFIGNDEKFGKVKIEEVNGQLKLQGKHTSADRKSWVEIDGTIEITDEKKFTFQGLIKTKDDKKCLVPCNWLGKTTFLMSGNRAYWRNQNSSECCYQCTGDMDIFIK